MSAGTIHTTATSVPHAPMLWEVSTVNVRQDSVEMAFRVLVSYRPTK